jgi:hypothetical protein
MNILLNSGWMKALIAKAIKIGMSKKAGIKAGLDINDLKISDDESGVKLHLDLDVTMSRDELERLIKGLM